MLPFFILLYLHKRQILNVSIFAQCVPILGRGFETGGYKCECKQGFEYPFEDLITYFDGQLMEAEFNNIVNDQETRYSFRDFLSFTNGQVIIIFLHTLISWSYLPTTRVCVYIYFIY